jgi:hypothetical protein
MKKQLLILMTLSFTLLGYSQTFTDNFITYSVTSTTANTVQTIDYNMAGGTIVNIPNMVSYNGVSYTVTQIGIDSFFNNQLTSVTIPDSVLYIINFAFATNQLQSVTIPDSVISIGGNAFVNNQISSLSIANGITAIGLAAFATNQLTSITLPESINSLAASVFNNNPLNSVFSESLTPPTITTGSGDSFNVDRSGIDLTIPNGTSSAYTAAGWTGFNSVTEASSLAIGDTFVVDFITYEVTSITPETVEAIDYDASGGTVVNIPAIVTNSAITYDVTSIGQQAFYNNGLTTVEIPGSVLNIDNLAFFYNNITSVTLNNGITSIGDSAFQNNQLQDIVLPNSITNISYLAFSENQLTNVTIPSNVISIGARVFLSNPLTCVISEATTPPTIVTNPGNVNDTFPFLRDNIDLSIPSGTATAYANATWTGFNSVAEGLSNTFVIDHITYQILASANSEVRVTGYNTAGGTVVNIPASVTSSCTTFSVTDIGSVAFNGKGLTSVTIPNSVTIINIGAFLQNSLTSIVIPDSVTFIGNLSFKSNQITSVVIPSGTLAGHESFKDNALVNVTFEDGVTSIGPNAFENNQISNITIPSSVTFIGQLTFAGNPLTDVTSLGTTPPSITTGTNDTFGSIANRGTINLHIPANTTGAYVTDPGALWTDFMSVTEDALSVSEFELANDIKVITTQDKIEVVSANGTILDNYTLYNISGAKIISGHQSDISTTALASGIYILKLDFNKGKVTKKVIVN